MLICFQQKEKLRLHFPKRSVLLFPPPLSTHLCLQPCLTTAACRAVWWDRWGRWSVFLCSAQCCCVSSSPKAEQLNLLRSCCSGVGVVLGLVLWILEEIHISGSHRSVLVLLLSALCSLSLLFCWVICLIWVSPSPLLPECFICSSYVTKVDDQVTQ